MAERNTKTDEGLERVLRGVVDCITLDELKAKLASGRKLCVKLGMDPTAPDVHLGHSVVLRKLRVFQDLGHQAVLIIGDATARVGDPSGQAKTRPMLTDEEIERNVATYLEQVGKILDLARLEIRRNGEWFAGVDFFEALSLASRMTVAQLTAREDFKKRLDAGAPLGLHELFYPVMQGYDSVMLKADVELGGTDQTFNLLVGRTLQRSFGQEEQVALTTPILPGLDGVRKMSKSLGNYIAVLDPPKEMFGKCMSIPDSVLRDYIELLTEIPKEEIDALLAKDRNPRDAKERLAVEVVSFYHRKEAALEEEAEFRRVFSEGGLPDDIPPLRLSESEAPGGEIAAARLLVLAGHAASMSEARRLISQGAVRLDDKKLADPRGSVGVRTGQILRTGRRRFARIEIS